MEKEREKNSKRTTQASQLPASTPSALHSGYHPGHQSARPHPCPLTHSHTHSPTHPLSFGWGLGLALGSQAGVDLWDLSCQDVSGTPRGSASRRAPCPAGARAQGWRPIPWESSSFRLVFLWGGSGTVPLCLSWIGCRPLSRVCLPFSVCQSLCLPLCVCVCVCVCVCGGGGGSQLGKLHCLEQSLVTN